MSTVKFVTYDKRTGQVLTSGYTGEAVVHNYETEDIGVLVTEELLEHDACYVDLNDMKAVKTDKRPSNVHYFDIGSKEWVIDGEMLANQMRLERDNSLKDTDWSQLPDVGESIKQSYAEYRRALRDITDQEGFPYNVTWPTKPEV